MKPKWTPDISTYKHLKYPCACEIKYDGEFVYHSEGKLWNKWGNEKCAVTKIPALGLYGELYYGEGKEYYSELHSHRNGNLKFIAFDTDGYGEVDYRVRRGQLENLKKFGFNIVEMKVCYNEEEMNTWYRAVVDRGYEGIVCKFLDSKTDKYWVKKKREFTATLLVKGLRKGKSVPCVAVGTKDNILGCCSLNGWDNLIEYISINTIIKGENKDYYWLSEAVKVEVKHNGILQSGKLRNPVVKRIRDFKEEINVY